MINVKETFLKLTTNRYPSGREDGVITLLPEFNFQKDEFGNYFIIIKKSDGTFSENMFTSHLDTICHMYDYSYAKISHVVKGDFIKTTGYSNLGADDKAGMVLMLNMISENIPGLYYFFIGEETGRIGSGKLARYYTSLVKDNKLPKLSRCISFDRKGYDFITTNQLNFRCCSDEFANSLAKSLNEYGFWYKPDSRGGRTDSYQFTELIPECTNISVGYFNEHTVNEMQDIDFLELLSLVVLKIDWDSLPIKRKITVVRNTNTTPHSYRNLNVQHSSANHVEEKYRIVSEIGDLTKDADFDSWYNTQKAKNIIFK